jgi:tubulin alpha
MAKCDQRLGKFLACVVNYRGNFMSKDIGASICNLKTKRCVQFVDWTPTGFKCGINPRPISTVPGSIMPRLSKSCFMIGNSTSIVRVFDRLSRKFDSMYNKRAFVHWYVS